MDNKFPRSNYWNKLQTEVWQPCRDLLDEFWSTDIKKRHLYPRPAEPTEAYTNRLRSAYLDNWFSTAVSSYAALLGKFDYTQDPNAPPQTITESDRSVPEALQASNVDFQGNDFKSFMNLLNQSTLALGCALIVVDVQDTPLGKRPYLKRWDIDDIFGLQTIQEGGKTFISQFAGRYEQEEFDEDDGEIETYTYFIQYLHRPARTILWKLDDGEFEIVSEAQLKGANGQPLQELPVVWHDFSGEPIGYPPLPLLLSLARLNISNFNSLSEFQTILTVVNGPTPLVFWPPGSPPPTERPDLYLGINTAYHMPAGGDVRFLEPSGNALNISWEVIQGQRDMMARLGQSFFSPGYRTATEARLAQAQSESLLLTMSNRVQNTAEEIFKWWQVFSDPGYQYPNYAGGLVVNTEALSIPMSAQESQAIESKFLNGLIDVKTAINLLVRRGWMSPDDLSDELKDLLRRG